jgi:hypothetical protein
MSEQILSEKIWRDVVDLLPNADIVSSDYTTISNPVEQYKYERFMWLVWKRNSLLADLLHMWKLACKWQKRLDKRPKSATPNYSLIFANKRAREQIDDVCRQLHYLLILPWPYTRITAFGVTHKGIHFLGFIKYSICSGATTRIDHLKISGESVCHNH